MPPNARRRVFFEKQHNPDSQVKGLLLVPRPKRKAQRHAGDEDFFDLLGRRPIQEHGRIARRRDLQVVVFDLEHRHSHADAGHVHIF